MDELDVSRFEHIDEAFFKELVSCDFVIKKQNIVMIGNPGTCKTHLSIALGMKACIQGMNVMFYTAANLSNELIEAQDNHRLVRLEKQISKVSPNVYLLSSKHLYNNFTTLSDCFFAFLFFKIKFFASLPNLKSSSSLFLSISLIVFAHSWASIVSNK